MLRPFLLISIAVLAVLSAPTDRSLYDVIPPEYKHLIPVQIKKYLKSFTPDEMKAFQSFATEYVNYDTDEEIVDLLKRESPSLYQKIVKLDIFLSEKYEKLDRSVQNLIKKVYKDILGIQKRRFHGEELSVEQMKKILRRWIAQYKHLSKEARDTVKEQFPVLTKFFKNKQVQEIIEEHIY